jgi:putative nucleotidyltransferase with HDIG domain
MATGGQKRTRSERVAALELPPGQWERAWVGLRRRDVMGRIVLALLAAVAMCCVIRGWDPPFAYRSGSMPSRDIVARVPFTQEDPTATSAARERARSEVRYIFAQDPKPLEQLRASLFNTVVELTAAPTLAKANRAVWRDFQPPPLPGKTPDKSLLSDEQQFQAFRAAFTGQEKLDRFKEALADAFAPFERRGLLDLGKLPQQPGKGSQLGHGNQEEIQVHPVGQSEPVEIVKVADVLIGDGAALHSALQSQLETKKLADQLFAWVRPRLTVTLQPDEHGTQAAQRRAFDAVQPVLVPFQPGQPLVAAGQVLGDKQIELLRLEYVAFLAKRPMALRVSRGGAVLFMIFSLFVLCGVHMRHRQRGPLASTARLAVILFLALVAVMLAGWATEDAWRAELVPLMLFGMTMAIVYRQELALLLAGVLAWIVTLAVGHGLPEFMLLLGTIATAVVNLGRIRSRSKLIYVGLAAGCVAAVLYVVMNAIENQPVDATLLKRAGMTGMWAVAAGFLMTGLLPFIEQTFGVLTDLSLLELGDVTHPLLQELVRRAPSTYNHSITVGSIAEAAAESIGARGLLVRVGAYFHDIGKMLKPGYFVENQGSEASRHETLVPAMSTLVIIAHIKDGSDLARQHHLPQPIVDLIQQHHGTTLVEYFYDRAHGQKSADPNGGEVDESIFRYPGPKPQTKEAAVLMLADAVESASRTLVDPTPARIESLVRGIAERRLHGGQFDESGLTLRELRTIERTMVMSLTAIYHGRLKYPEQRTA